MLQADVEKPLLIVSHGPAWLPAVLSLLLFLRHEKQNCQNVPDALHRQKALLWLSLFFCGVVSGKQHCFLAVYYARSETSGAKGNSNFLVVAFVPFYNRLIKPSALSPAMFLNIAKFEEIWYLNSADGVPEAIFSI